MGTRIYFGADGASTPALARRGTEPPDSPGMCTGYAAVFYNASDPGTEYPLFDDLVEHVMPGCFDRALAEADDCRGLVNHDPNLLIGRSTSGTLRLSVDRTGLQYQCDLPDSTAGRDSALSIIRGDMTGSSFSFVVTDSAWIDQKDGPTIRELHSVALFDVSPVTYPAYTATTVSMGRDVINNPLYQPEGNSARARSAATQSIVRRRMAELSAASRGNAPDWPASLRKVVEVQRAVKLPASAGRARQVLEHDLAMLRLEQERYDRDRSRLRTMTNAVDRRALEVELDLRHDQLRRRLEGIGRYLRRFNQRMSNPPRLG